jgi:hypothetical protein
MPVPQGMGVRNLRMGRITCGPYAGSKNGISLPFLLGYAYILPKDDEHDPPANH